MNSLSLILKNPRYLAPAMVFASLNILMGTWAIYIPHIKSKLKLDDGEFGFAILFFGLGTFVMILLAPSLIHKLKIGKSTAYGLFIFMLLFLFPFLVSSFFELCLALFFIGFSAAFTDIAMNSLVSEIEKEDGIHIMSANHGFFSLGGMISAGIGTWFLPLVSVPFYHITIVIALMLVINGYLTKYYITFSAGEIEKTNFSFSELKPVLALVIISFFIMGSEGAVENWSALYLQNVSMADEKFYGIGFTAFSLTMALGRFYGDNISKRIGSIKIMLIGICIALIGFLNVLLADLIYAIIGFALIGLGFSVVVPELYRIGGKLPGVSSSKGIAMIAGMGFIGFLITPFLMGVVSDWSSLKYSFGFLMVFSIISLLLILTIKKK